MSNNSVPGKNLHYDLIQKCKSHNKAAQFEIYKLYYRVMFSISLRIINNRTDAEDIMQDSFLSAFQKIETYKGDVSFGAWLKKIVINKSIDALRSRKKLFEELNENEEITEEEGTDFSEESNVLVEKIKYAISLLPDGYRIVTSLYLIEGYDHEEIAQILGISESSSRSQLVRAKKKLIELMNKNEQL